MEKNNLTDKDKEIIDIRKRYLEQEENFQTKLYYSLMLFSLSIVSLGINKDISSYVWQFGIVGFIFVLFSFLFTRGSRKKRFKKIENYIINIK